MASRRFPRRFPEIGGTQIEGLAGLLENRAPYSSRTIHAVIAAATISAAMPPATPARQDRQPVNAPTPQPRPAHLRRRKNPRAIAYWIEQYRSPDYFAELAVNTQAALKREGDNLHGTLGRHHVDQITRRVVKRFVGLRPASMRSQALWVFRGVLETACDAGAIHENPDYGIRVPGSSPRKAVRSDADVAAFPDRGPRTAPH